MSTKRVVNLSKYQTQHTVHHEPVAVLDYLLRFRESYMWCVRLSVVTAGDDGRMNVRRVTETRLYINVSEIQSEV